MPRATSNGSWLQLCEGACFQGESDQYEDYPWPRGDYWIVGRELLIYKAVSLSLVPKPHRQKVLSQNITRLSPFQSTGQHVIEEEGFAEVWIWDEALRLESLSRVSDGHSDMEPKLQRLKAIPETLLFEPRFNGKAVQPMADGLEVQIWSEGRLTKSSWQPNDEDEVKRSISKAESWLDTLDLNAPTLEPVIWRSGLWLLGLFMLYQGGVYVGWATDINQYERRYTEVTARAADLMALRSEARLERKLNDQLTAWHSQPLQMSVLAEFDNLIPETAELRSWSYDDRNLRVTVFDPELNNRTYIENLEGSQSFTNVRIEPGVEVNTAAIELEVKF